MEMQLSTSGMVVALQIRESKTGGVSLEDSAQNFGYHFFKNLDEKACLTENGWSRNLFVLSSWKSFRFVRKL